MKRLAICVLTGLICFGSTVTFSQTKNETLQEKVIRLSIENKALQEENKQLRERIADLEKKPAPKAYYKTLDIEKICEKYPHCQKWAVENYQRDNLFEITSIEASERAVLSSRWQRRSHKTATHLSIKYRTSYPGPHFLSGMIVAYDGIAIE